MMLDISDDLYAALMSALRVLERTDPRYGITRKSLLQAMVAAAHEEIIILQQEIA